MSDESYNGWSNRETWAVALHLNNTEAAQNWMLHILPQVRVAIEDDGDSVLSLADRILIRVENELQEGVEGAFERVLDPGAYESDSLYEYAAHDIGLSHADALRMIADVGSLWRVNWREIAKSLIEDSAE